MIQLQADQNNPRIAMVLARFYPVLGGTEKQALLLAQYLQKQGRELFVVTARQQQQKACAEQAKIKIYRTASYFSGWSGSLIFMFSSFIFLWRRRSHFDIIHVFLAGSPALMAVLLGRLLHKKVVLKFGGAGPTGDIATSNKSLLGRIKLAILRKTVTSFVVPTNEIKNEIKKNKFPAAKIQLIANGVDTGLFIPVNAAAKKELKQNLQLPYQQIVTFAGRLEPGKGTENLLSSWEQVNRQFPEAHLLILGEGCLKSNLMDGLTGKACADRVHFLGQVNEMEKYLQCSDIFVLPSEAEGLSNALLEAASCGLAIIASDIGGTNELIKNGGNGLLIPARDSRMLAEKVILLLGQEQERVKLGTAARQTVTANYDIAVIARKYMNLYENYTERKNLDTNN